MCDPHIQAPVAQLTAMRPADLPYVDQIEQRSFPTPWSKTLYRRELERNPFSFYRVIRATAAGKVLSLPPILAYGGCWVMDDAAHILTIASHPELRRRCLGEWILLSLLRDAIERAAAQATLEVRIGNRVAIALYEKMGFVESGLRQGYYPPARGHGREDALLLTLSGLNRAEKGAEIERQLEEVRDLALRLLREQDL
jgi:ribosomal-protein-alanine N-acetyltransferase